MSGFKDIDDDDWDAMVGAVKDPERPVGWLIIVGTEEDAGRYILKTIWCDHKGKLRQEEKELSDDLRMPNFVHKTTWERLQTVLAALSIANVGDPVIGVGQKIADDVYWIEASYEKTFGL